MRKRYNTPHCSRIVKTRMTEEEYAELAERLSSYNMSQAEFIRQAITGAAIRPVIHVSAVNDELLAAVGKLTAEYGKIGGNLNQIARTLNEWHSPYPQLAGEVRAAVSDLAALKWAAIRPVIHVSAVNDELLAAVGKLTAEYGKIGGNLNQIARTLNEWHSPYPQLAGEVRAAVSDLAALKFEVLQKVGGVVCDTQTYQL